MFTVSGGARDGEDEDDEDDEDDEGEEGTSEEGVETAGSPSLLP